MGKCQIQEKFYVISETRREESKHSFTSLENMGSNSQVLGAEMRMHSLTVDCNI